MISRMNQRAKNHGLFLRAAARVSAKFSAVEFVLVGMALCAANWNGK